MPAVVVVSAVLVVVVVSAVLVVVVVVVSTTVMVVAVLLFPGVNDGIDSKNQDSDSTGEDEVVKVRGEVFTNPGGVVKVKEDASP